MESTYSRFPAGATTTTTTSTTATRPVSLADGDHFADDHISPTPPTPINYLYGLNYSRPQSAVGESTALAAEAGRSSYFRSRRVRKGEVQRPWLAKKDPKEKWVTIIPIIGLVLGVILAAILVWDGLRTVVINQYRIVLDENFHGGFNDKIWTKEVEVGGFGNGQFEMTTNTNENVFVRNNQLIIKPTLQDESLITTNNVVNLTAKGICTSKIPHNCVAATNVTNGTIVNPVKSARINTKKGATIKYGRIEIMAKMPEGDWMWPAIWMMPVNSTYGPWPLSGEIDIAESRGNNYTYGQGGNNIVSSALHWGPNTANDGWWQTNVKRRALHTTYAKSFHTFGLEWSEKYLFTYVDTRLLQVLYTNFNKPLWQRGNFPLADGNGTRLVDPWSQTGRLQTPFDQDFFLIINVAVGGTNGWFKDGASSKPWVDDSPSARHDFWNARKQWYPTWAKNGEMVIDSVKMWQQVNKH
ncbi:MAG: hypothetical protein M1826_003089 [Phylliscum demangeonii]|nr:MAG: hypothetical protein M1826_003089 [Phylliscum demangeonii]